MVWPALEEDELWHRFSTHTNEMIITKAGRCLFPILRVRFQAEPTDATGPVAIEPGARYDVLLSMQPLDRHRWRFRAGRGWRPAGVQDAGLASLVDAPLVPRLPLAAEPHAVVVREHEEGAVLLRGISFEHVKVTNREAGEGREDGAEPGSATITLRSFHRYAPVVHLRDAARVQSVAFRHTAFVAVTHYQNEATTALKKSYNPHAKGFLPTGAHGRAALARTEATGDARAAILRPRLFVARPVARMRDHEAPVLAIGPAALVGDGDRRFAGDRTTSPQPSFRVAVPSSMSPASDGAQDDDREILLGALALHGISIGRRLSYD